MLKIMYSVAITALLAITTGWVTADEEKIPLDKLPKAVSDAVTKRFPKAKMIGAEKETEGDKTEYEVVVKDGDSTIEVTLTPEGQITSIEKTMAAKDLPKAVNDALDTKYPKATIKKAEEVTKVKDGKEVVEYYEVLLVSADKKIVEVKIAADGNIKKTEEKKQDKKQDKKEEKEEDDD